MDQSISDQVKELTDKFQEFAVSAESLVGQILQKGALDIQADAQRSMSPPPSEPGEPPAVRTGRLRASITSRVVQDGDNAIVEVGTNVVYAVPLEFGTEHIKPRPFMGPALERHRVEIIHNLAQAVRQQSNA